MRVNLLFGACVWCAAAHASAEPQASAAETSSASEHEAFCDYVNAVARSESLPLIAPWFFGNALTLQEAGDSSGIDPGVAGSSGRGLRARIQAGASISPSSMLRGFAVRNVGKAECRRYKAELDLNEWLKVSVQLGPSPLRHKLSVLEQALEHAEALATQSARELAAGVLTIREHDAVLIRIDGLRRQVSATRAELSGLAELKTAQGSLDALVTELAQSESELLQQEAAVRKSRALDVTIRAGYDKILGIEQELPLLAALQLQFTPGYFAQLRAESVAHAAQARYQRAKYSDRQAELQTRMEALRSLQRAEQGRLREVQALLADLGARQKQLESIGGTDARRHADHLWFEVVALDAERVFLEERQRVISALGGGSTASSASGAAGPAPP